MRLTSRARRCQLYRRVKVVPPRPIYLCPRQCTIVFGSDPRNVRKSRYFFEVSHHASEARPTDNEPECNGFHENRLSLDNFRDRTSAVNDGRVPTRAVCET